jgi:hypothetical protein
MSKVLDPSINFYNVHLCGTMKWNRSERLKYTNATTSSEFLNRPDSDFHDRCIKTSLNRYISQQSQTDIDQAIPKPPALQQRFRKEWRTQRYTKTKEGSV